jgi:dipeptidyl aminopeptidase/acylaminoacyl peptidase
MNVSALRRFSPRLGAGAVVIGLAAVAAPVGAQQVSYSRAEQLLNWNADRLVSGDQVSPQWLKDGNRFWYRNKTASGAEFVLVDPASASRTLLFDHVKLAQAMTSASDTAFDGNKLPFQTFKFTKDGDNESEIEFNAVRKRFVCNIQAYRCTASDTLPSDVPFVKSPDRKLEAFISKNNLWVRNAETKKDSVQLTTDGVEYYSYGTTMPRPSQLQRPQPTPVRPQLRWSPDSKKIAVMRPDERGVEHMHYISYTPQRPKHYSQPYALPGDTAVPYPHIHIVDVTTKSNVAVKIAPRPNQLSLGGSVRDSAWAPNSSTLKVSFYTRGSKSAYLGVVDATTGDMRVVARDTGKTFVEISNPQDPGSFYVTKDMKDAFWWSERDGWGHLYRFDASGVSSVVSTDGDGGMTLAPAPKSQLTSGAWQIGQISYVDEIGKKVYFTGRGRDGFLYYAKLYRANYDGTGLTLVTPEDANHVITFSPSGKYIVDTYSRIEAAPVTVLRSAATGNVIKKLEEADISRLSAIGWKPGQVFSVKARDGVTDIYGVLYLPPNLDSTKKYPIISHIYPGPQVGSVGAWSFKNGGEQFSLAALGFVVIQLDHLGTPLRSKVFHDNYYGNFGDNGLLDHITAIKQLGARYKFIDVDRVGIFGHSGGGFASTDAMLRYPEFFKVAVSSSGNHDNRSYNIYWAEKYQGLMKKDTVRKSDNFESSANKTMAKNLQGHLMLMHGDMDDNVHPANTIQLIDELEKANRAFDLVWAPNRNHGLNEPYFIRRRWDYFVQYLMGATPPDNYLIVQPTPLPGGAPGAPDADDPDPDGWPYWKPFRLPN